MIALLWENVRNDFYFKRDEIVTAYSESLGKSKEEAENWFDKAEERYELSVEKFAARVREYIKSKGNNHHVIFLVDEICLNSLILLTKNILNHR